MPGQTAPGSLEAALDVCRRESQQTLNTIEHLSGQLEAARQVNSGPQMRAAMDALQDALGMLRQSAAACAGNGERAGDHSAHATPAPAVQSGEGHSAHPPSQTSTTGSAIKVTVTDGGFEPASLNLKKGEQARVTFVRLSDRTCGTEVVIPEFGVRKPLPLNEPVLIEFAPMRSGEFTFTCGMNMLKGLVVVR